MHTAPGEIIDTQSAGSIERSPDKGDNAVEKETDSVRSLISLSSLRQAAVPLTIAGSALAAWILLNATEIKATVQGKPVKRPSMDAILDKAEKEGKVMAPNTVRFGTMVDELGRQTRGNMPELGPDSRFEN